ncbi:MAG: hypothetical protein QME64_10385, partial [bacterium]|nr:hypothetical protein [bacterium]
MIRIFLSQIIYLALLPTIIPELAMSAYDARYARYGTQVQARSPAIDKGAVRITPASIAGTNANVTCSNFASLGWTNSEDTVDNNRDCQTTLRWIQQTTYSNYTDPVGRLDLGYHYKKGVVYTTDIVSTFRFNNRTYVYDTVGDYLVQQSENLRKVVSGKFDTNTLNGTNLVIFPASGLRTTDQYIGLGYHVQGTPIVKGIAEYSCPTTWDGWSEGITLVPAMWLNFLDIKSSPDGTIYTAINGTKKRWSPPYSPYYEFLYVYRYDAASSRWTTIVTMEWTHSGASSLSGFAIAADTGYLWLAISLKNIKIAAIPYSSFPSTVSINSSIWKTPYQLQNIAPQLHMTYDETYSNQVVQRPTVRLIYHNWGGPGIGDGNVHAARIEFDSNTKK